MSRVWKYTKGFYFLTALCWLSIVLIAIPVVAQTSEDRVFVIDPADQEYAEGMYNVLDYVDIFIDSTGLWTIEQIVSNEIQQRFAPDTLQLTHTLFSDFGPDIKFIWARIVVASKSNRYEEWLINFSAHEVEGYIEDEHNVLQHYRSGLFIPDSARQFKGIYSPITCLGLNVMPGDTITAFLRLKTPRFGYKNAIAEQFNATLFRRDVFYTRNKPFQAWIFFICGVVISIAVYHLIIYYYQRNRVTLYFSLFLLAYLVVYISYKGAHYLISPNTYLQYGMPILLANMTLLAVCTYLFSREFLHLKQLAPTWDKIWRGLAILFVMHGTVMVTIFIVPGDWSDANPDIFWPLVTVRGVLNFSERLLIALVGILCWIRGTKVAWIYLLAMTPYALQQTANDVNYFTQPVFLEWLYGDAGTVFMVLMFVFGVARQIKGLQDAKVAADRATALEKASAERLKELDEFKTRFYTNITHQFRTPLTVILGMADQIKSHPTTWINEGTDLIKRNGQRLLQLINQILNLSRLDAGRLEVTMVQGDINQYISFIVESFHSLAAQNKLQLAFLPDPEEVVIDYDPEILMDIISNLISNAIKFTGVGGSIELRTSVEDSHTFTVTVSDTGVGISEELLPRIFDRFYQADPGTKDKQGSGIGLALVKELTELLGGNASVQSIPEKGTTFTISLPISRDAPMAGPGEVIPQTVSRHSNSISEGFMTQPVQSDERPLVLVVDDNADVVTYIKSVLIDTFDVVEEYNGNGGLKKAISIIPDLIVSDIMMPEMDGIEMCQKLKSDRLTSHIPVLLLTAKTDTPSRIEGWHAGADAYLTKPFDREELLVRVSELISIRSKLQERYRDIRHLFKTEGQADGAGLNAEDQFMQELHSIINSHLGDPAFSIAQLCKEIGMSRTPLYKKFKALTGLSIAHFIRKIRLHKAHELLQTGRYNVTQAAIETGFSNHSSFSRSFREEFGLSPSEIHKPVS